MKPLDELVATLKELAVESYSNMAELHEKKAKQNKHDELARTYHETQAAWYKKKAVDMQNFVC